MEIKNGQTKKKGDFSLYILTVEKNYKFFLFLEMFEGECVFIFEIFPKTWRKMEWKKVRQRKVSPYFLV